MKISFQASLSTK